MKLLPFSCIFIAFVFKFSESSLARVCKEFRSNVRHDFHPLRHCQRSNKTVIAYSDAENVQQCADFAKTSKALAFNFSPHERQNKNLFNDTMAQIDEMKDFYNCQVLECPEYRNFSSVVNDTRFDYYSMYTFPTPIENSTCIPSLGMFTLHKERKNYSSACETCHSIGGQLAHIASERRTNEISKLLRNSFELSKDVVAFVGLNETALGKFVTSNAEPLECFDYVAFESRHPAEIRKPSCVVITKRSSWKAYSCTRKLEFICELLASGPNPYANNFKQKCSVKRPNNRFAPKKVYDDD